MKKLFPFLLISSLFFCMESQAVHLSSTGTGQVLIFPYYTVNNGINTLMNLVNTTDQSKALRVRFREAANSREVFAFNLYLGPQDVWTGALVKDNDLTRIISADLSCTIPSINISGQLFYNNKFMGNKSDAYEQNNNRLYEGFVEVIEMGVLTGESAGATLIYDTQPQGNCSVFNDAWDSTSNNAYWITNPKTDMLPPSGGIMGNLVLIDVNKGIAVTQEATTFSNFSDEILHFSIDDDSPNLSDGNKQAEIVHNEKIINTAFEKGIDAVSFVLMKSTISNEYVLDSGINAETEWILTLPTRQFYTDKEITASDSPLPPFSFINASGIACESFLVTRLFDREEQSPPNPGGGVITNAPIPPITFPVLCYAANTLPIFLDIEYSGDSRILGGHFTGKGIVSDRINTIIDTGGNLIAPYQAGWTTVAFENLLFDGTNSVRGIPLIGFSVQRYTNANLSGGVLANYAGLFNHKSTTEVTTSSSQETQSGMAISKDNTGQVLIFPYYSVRNGLNTLISVVNTTDEVKAVKVRFLEGKNSRECLDFNLYLSPYDVWTAALISTTSSAASGLAGDESTKIITSDTSCTLPSINDQEFLSFAFTGSFDDGITADMVRCTEGYFEIIEMGLVRNTATNGIAEGAATHVAGTPDSCGTLVDNWLPGGAWQNLSTDGLLPPTGGLYGSASLIDVTDGVDMTYDATAIVNYSSEAQHTAPGIYSPNLSTGTTLKSLIESEGGYLQLTWNSSLDALSSLFMYDEIINDYVISDVIGAQTDWVNTYPTKSFYVDPAFANVSPSAPFNSSLSPGKGACELLQFQSYNREQLSNYSSLPVPLLPPGNYDAKHCWSVSTSYVDDKTDALAEEGSSSEESIFDSNLLMENWIVFNGDRSIFNVNSAEGWMKMKLDLEEEFDQSWLEGKAENGELYKLYGKPVLGFTAQKYVNSRLEDGVLANYGVINMNKGRRKIVVDSANHN